MSEIGSVIGSIIGFGMIFVAFCLAVGHVYRAVRCGWRKVFK